MAISDFRIGAGELEIDGVSVGETTEEGMVVTYEPDVHFHNSGKYGNTPVKASLIGQTLTLEVYMAENTSDNLVSAMAGVTEDGGKLQFGGQAGREINGVKLELKPFDGTDNWVFRNAVPESSVELNYSVNDERVIQVTFRAMIDTDGPTDEELGYIS